MSGRKAEYLAFLLILAVGLGMFSCRKDTNINTNFQRGVESAQNYVFAQQMMTQIMSTYFRAITDSVLLADEFAYVDGAAVYYYPNQSPRKIIFDYPSYGVSDGYGHVRGGIIEANTSGEFDAHDAVVGFIFRDFKYDNDSVDVDSMYLRNLGKKYGASEVYQVASARVDYRFLDSSGIFSFSFDEEFILHKYPSTVYSHPGDSLEIFGKLAGNTVRNIDFTAHNPADSALLFSYTCKWLKSGIVEIETESFNYLTTAYFQHPDTCRNQFLVVIDENPFPKMIEE